MLTFSPQVIQQTLGQQVSMPVAQIVAGFSKVFVGEIVEKGSLSNLLSSSRLRQASSTRGTRTERRCGSTVTGPSARGLSCVPAGDWAGGSRTPNRREEAFRAMSTVVRRKPSASISSYGVCIPERYGFCLFSTPDDTIS
jgi:hypothetical protein